jgi:hypothetical protein
MPTTIDPNTVVLLGAGASAEAGIPMSRPMTRKIADAINASAPYRRAAGVLNFVCATLLAFDAAETGASPFESLDVERVFAAVELLARRRDLEVTPFVGAWHPAVDAVERGDLPPPNYFETRLQDGLMGRFGTLTDAITELIDARVGRRPTGSAYDELAGLMLAELRRLVSTTAKQVDYLKPLVAHGQQRGGLTVATLNYDRSIEIACAEEDVQVTTGIAHWIDSGYWGWPPVGVRLLKLHGSIDWAWIQETDCELHLPREVVVVTPEPVPGSRPALIFGQGAKLRAQGPFLSLLAEFERQLASASRLVAIGYSFRDDHVNEIVRRWLADDTNHNLLVIDPGWPTAVDYSNLDTDFRAALEHYLVPRPRSGPPPTSSARLEVWHKSCGEAVYELCHPA